MEFRDLLAKRSSCRQFRPDPVPVEDLREMVRLAGLAPSPANAQPWRFIAVVNRELLEAMATAVRRRLAEILPDPSDAQAARARAKIEWFSTFFVEAPAVVAVTLSPYRAVIDELLEGAETELTHDAVNAMRMMPDLQAIGAAVEHLLLAATDTGYAGCWLSGPLMARREVENLLDVRAPQRLAAMVAVGKPALIESEGRPRKVVDDIFDVML